MSRVVSWFSCGTASAVATKLALQKYGEDNVKIVYCDTGGEHPDNKRFLKDCEKWYGKEIQILKNDKYENHFEVYEKTKFLISPYGARCTIELKKSLRDSYQKVDDKQIFGYTIEEKQRAERFNKNFPEVKTDFILIENQITKDICNGIILESGIEIPKMYKLGYGHNNCVGCVKGGKGYWNKIRVDFPEQFQRMSKIERDLDIKINDKFLDEMATDEGNFKKEKIISCDFMCQILNAELK